MDWHSLLNKYGVDVPNTDQFSILCPFHEDTVRSCSINLDKGVWICFAGCGQGSLKSFVWKISGKSWRDIQEEFEIPDFDFGDFTAEDTESREVFNQSIYGEELFPIAPTHWIYKRGFTKHTLDRWGCLENKYRDLVIPVNSSDEDILGWITRRINAIPKYLYSKGFRKSRTLFGVNNLVHSEVVYLVEGPLDCMWLDQHGYPSVAILGASVSSAQIDLLSKYHPSEVVLGLDNDEAGRKGIEKATVDMSNRFMVSFVEFPENTKDFQEVRDPKMLEKIINNRSIW